MDKPCPAGLQPEPDHQEAAARYLAWRPPAASLLDMVVWQGRGSTHFLLFFEWCVQRGAYADGLDIEIG
jgi:hypothetical protein